MSYADGAVVERTQQQLRALGFELSEFDIEHPDDRVFFVWSEEGGSSPAKDGFSPYIDGPGRDDQQIGLLTYTAEQIGATQEDSR